LSTCKSNGISIVIQNVLKCFDINDIKRSLYSLDVRRSIWQLNISSIYIREENGSWFERHHEIDHVIRNNFRFDIQFVYF